jgi:hypothetical protein
MPVSEKKAEYGSQKGCPKVSAERFGELISLYLDKEASQSELELLSLLLRTDESAKLVFQKSCRIHLATCRMFGKNCVLGKLPDYHMPRRKRVSRRRAAFEWTAVAALMVMSFLLFAEANAPVSSGYMAAEGADFSGEDARNVSDNFVAHGNSFSIFELEAKK